MCAHVVHSQPRSAEAAAGIAALLHSETDRQRCFKTGEGSQLRPLLVKVMNKGRAFMSQVARFVKT